MLTINLIDIAALSPYQYVYMNELARARDIHKNTDIDYWGASLGELYRKSKVEYALFPNESRYLNQYRAFAKINLPSRNESVESKLYLKEEDEKYIDNSKCKKVISVDRIYPLTKTKLEVSSIFHCEI